MYNKIMIETELERYHTLSNLGDIEAIHQLIDYYLEIGDQKKAFLNAKRFEYIEDKEGYRKLGYFYEHGISTDVDLEVAKDYYLKAYLLGDYLSGYNLALIFLREERFFECAMYLPLAVYNNHLPSVKLLATLYLKGDGLEKNVEVALNLFKLAVSLGDKTSFYKIGKILFERGDHIEASKYLLDAVKNNDYDACYLLATSYLRGLGVSINVQKAMELYEIGADHDNIKCMHALAMHYQKGIGVKQDLEKSQTLLERIKIVKEAKQK